MTLGPHAIAEQADGVTWVCRFCGAPLSSSAHKCEGLERWFETFLTSDAGRALQRKGKCE